MTKEQERELARAAINSAMRTFAAFCDSSDPEIREMVVKAIRDAFRDEQEARS